MDNVKAILAILTIPLVVWSDMTFGPDVASFLGLGLIGGYILGVCSRDDEVLKLSKRIWALESKPSRPLPLQADPKPVSEYPSATVTPEKI